MRLSPHLVLTSRRHLPTPNPPRSTPMAGEIVVEVPDIGDFTDVPVIEVHVGAGSEIALDEPLLTLESDKATMDVPAEVAGTVRELRLGVGDRVSRGSPILVLDPADAGG